MFRNLAASASPYNRLRQLGRLQVEKRGWMLEGRGPSRADALRTTIVGRLRARGQSGETASGEPAHSRGEILRLAALAQEDYPRRIVRFGNSCKCCGIWGWWNCLAAGPIVWFEHRTAKSGCATAARTGWREAEIRNAKFENREQKGRAKVRPPQGGERENGKAAAVLPHSKNVGACAILV